MNICGIDLKGSDAIVAVIQIKEEHITYIDTSIRKISLGDSDINTDVIKFKNSVEKFFRKNEIEKVFIKKRMKKGKFAGGPDSFKMEGIIQIIEGAESTLISSQSITAKLKKDPIDLPTDLKKYQYDAFLVARTSLL